MPDLDKAAQYIASAMQAEGEAVRAMDPLVAQNWISIAQAYRELAELAARRP